MAEPSEYTPCALGPCAAPDGHKGTCAQASGWDTFTEEAKGAAFDAGFAAGRASVVAEEPEWEYGERSALSEHVLGPYTGGMAASLGVPEDRLVRRRKAGSWVPVKQGDETDV